MHLQMSPWLLLLILLHPLTSLASDFAARFEHLTVEDGLSQVTVYANLQDHQGFMWFGTQDGLNRYDGYTFKVFRHDPQIPGSISDNYIKTLYQDSKGRLWIGTRGGGLNRFDADTEHFIYFKHNTSDPHSLSHNEVNAIFEDDKGILWVGTHGGGLNRFDETSGQFTYFKHNDENPNSLSNNKVIAIHQDSKNQLWIGTASGLNRYDPQQQRFHHYRHQASNPHSLSHNTIKAILEDSKGKLWIGTNNGLNQFDDQQQRFVRFSHRPSDPRSLSHNNITNLFEDSRGRLWIGTEAAGLNRYENPRQGFVRFNHQIDNPYSLSAGSIQSISEDAQGTLWIGTNSGAINKLDSQKQRFGHVRHQASNPQSLSNSAVFAIHKDKQGTLWIGTNDGLNKLPPARQNLTDPSEPRHFIHYKHQPSNPGSLSQNAIVTIMTDDTGTLWVGAYRGLNQYNPLTDKFIHFRHQPSDSGSLSHDTISKIYQDSKGTLWVGTFGGLNQYNAQTGQFKRYLHSPSDTHSLSNDTIVAIFEDSKGTLWIGTHSGLNRFDAQTQTFDRYQHLASDPHSLSHDAVYSIHEDNNGTLWFATLGGLNKFDAKSQRFSHYRQKDGLANDTLYAVLEDKQGYLWLSSNKGLSRFNPTTETFVNFDANDGLQSDEFNFGAYFKSDDGELFFGGMNGFNRFYPQNITDDSHALPVVLTDFLLANKSVPINPLPQATTFNLPKAINAMDKLTLSYQQNLISFEFAALHFSNPMKTQYAYQLVGQDDNWIKTDAKKRWATYTNLAPGDYTLRIKASNQQGNWNERGGLTQGLLTQGKSLKITVLPPPWKTWWAYSIYILVLALMIYAFVRIQRKKVLYERSVNLRLTQVDKLKDEFLANTSHELRTPLNGIIGLAESLMDGIAGPQSKSGMANLSMIVSSGKRLSHLINDILDFSKLKNHNLTLNTHPVDLHSMAEVVLTLSRPLLGSKPVELVNAVRKDICAAQADEDRLQQILHNLVGNAIKFTETGKVTVSAVATDEQISISVSDTGIGIEKDKFATIFDSFEQLEGHTERVHNGTGLGLAVSRQLVELHGGTITVESQLGQGSTFSFTLAMADEKPQDNNAIAGTNGYNRPVANQAIAQLHPFEDDNLALLDTSHEGSQFRILLVDDEPVNRQVLHNHLFLQQYQLVEACDGEQALRMLNEDGPFDLVLLDIMMPKMSGYEVAQQIRLDWAANALPIIMLTAKNQLADLVEGFSCGTNDYLAKPFAKEELLARIKTQLNLMKINAAYERFLPSEFLKMLNHESIVDVRLGDQTQKEMTILFLDIRAFTSLSEQMTPKQNFDFLNEFLSHVIPSIRANSGFIDKYIGDAVMALFPHSPDDAVNASIAILKQLQLYNEQRQAQQQRPINVGIGLHTGTLMLGTIGDNHRMDGTVISDAVNLASRLESLTKTYGASLVVSEQCFSKLATDNPFHHRPLGRVRVKGKHEVITVIEIIDGDLDQVMALKKASMADFQQAMARYDEKDFEGAASGFRQVLRINPADQSAHLYHQRSAKYMLDGAGEEWSGTEL